MYYDEEEGIDISEKVEVQDTVIKNKKLINSYLSIINENVTNIGNYFIEYDDEIDENQNKINSV